MSLKWRRTILILICVPVSVVITCGGEIESNQIRDTVSLINSDPIVITSDDDLLAFPGSGTSTDPYVIENYNITSSYSYGIYITSITKYVHIKNCYIDVSKTSILIENSIEAGAKIENNICLNSEEENGNGIFISLVKDVYIKDTICFNHKSSGIVLNYVYAYAIMNTTCYANGDSGIVVSGNKDAAIFDSKCFENGKKGIYLKQAEFTFILNNTFSRNGEEGIYLEEHTDTLVLNNTIEENELRGIILDSSSGCIVQFNLFKYNIVRGVYLDKDSEKNSIVLNDFISNSFVGQSQGRDEGEENYWYSRNGKKGNYWDNLNGDSTYAIEGAANSFDLYPTEESIVSGGLTDNMTNTLHFDFFTLIISTLVLIYIFKIEKTW